MNFSLFADVDYGWAQALHSVQNGFFNVFFKYFSYLADKGIIIFIAAIALMMLKSTRRIGTTILVCVALSLLMSFIAKGIVDRPRPFADVESDYYAFWVAAGKASASKTGSFPSGHATVAFAPAVSMIMTLDKRYGWTGILFGLVIIVARTYLMVHYLTDVLGGAAFGVI
ncbi:MAG: phosphatase PAP2 family protein, partial [Clostridia bacterium]|nr:phosphatase PAP2 family protein [Clostridia bacterium]